MYRHVSIVRVCTRECACVDRCSTIGTQGDSCECTSHHGACDSCGIQFIIHASN